MRASREGRHISGAERIVDARDVPAASSLLATRAARHPLGPPDEMHIAAHALRPEDIRVLPALKQESHELPSVADARHTLARILRSAGISERAADRALHALCTITGVPGAQVLDEDGRDTGVVVRARRLDHVGSSLSDPQKNHFLEALTLATKVASAPGALAELCISDDPSYLRGYVACAGTYHRVSPLKEEGEPVGTRIILVRRGTDLDALGHYLRDIPVIVQ